MPFILALISIAAAAYFWINRARNAGEIAGEVLDMANDVRLAARRFGFKRKTNLHPTVLRADAEEAQEMEVLGRWFMSECGGSEPAIARISRKLYKLGGAEQMEPLITVLKGTVKDELSTKQRDALDDIQRAMRVR